MQSRERLLLSPFLGAVFENFIVIERMKKYLNIGKNPRLFLS
jgi:hypothetical protein